MGKEEVLKVMEQNKGEYLTGVEVAAKLNISKSAASRCLSGLVREGLLELKIFSRKNWGYTLIEEIKGEADGRIQLDALAVQ